MTEFSQGKTPRSGDGNEAAGSHGPTEGYLHKALEAALSGDNELGMHLYLAAFEEEAAKGEPSQEALDGLRTAWSLACDTKERALAEYIFEKLAPFLSPEETSKCIMELQTLSFDRLEEFGVSIEDIQRMAESFGEEIMGFAFGGDDAGADGEGFPGAPFDFGFAPSDEGETLTAEPVEGTPEDPQEFNPLADLKLPDLPDMPDFTVFGALPGGGFKKLAERKSSDDSPANFLAKAAEEMDRASEVTMDDLTYDTLAGYGTAVRTMRDLGVGMKDNPEFQQLVAMLNERHGLERMPSTDTVLFRSPIREDANRFMAATVGELGKPVVRMNMEENFSGNSLLCVSAAARTRQKLSAIRSAFVSGGVLVLEDIDLWMPPMLDGPEDPSSFFLASLSHGARDALNLIRAAVENPDVTVFATASDAGEIDAFFLDLLEPLTVVDIDYPTEEERREIWLEIARAHPSIRSIGLSDVVRLSASMARYDIYMAAREAIEEAYKTGLVNRAYVPVSRENLFEKMAAYQPLDSIEYLELERAVIDGFSTGLDDLDGLLD